MKKNKLRERNIIVLELYIVKYCSILSVINLVRGHILKFNKVVGGWGGNIFVLEAQVGGFYVVCFLFRTKGVTKKGRDVLKIDLVRRENYRYNYLSCQMK